MANTYIILSEHETKYFRNYYHFFFNYLIHILTYMKNHSLIKETTYLGISDQINERAPPFFKDVLKLFVNIYIIQRNEIIKPILIDAKTYRDRNILYDILSKLQAPITKNKQKIVYIKRKGKRYILNDDECINILNVRYKDKYDIVVAELENMTFKEQIDLMNGCTLLIGCHGAGFTNICFMEPGSTLFELFPESFYVDCFKQMCYEKNINHFYLHGKSSNHPPLTLDEFLKNSSLIKYNNAALRSSIRDVTFTIDINDFTKKICLILSI